MRIARLLSTWVAGYDARGYPIYEADAQTDAGAFVRVRLVGWRWEVI